MSRSPVRPVVLAGLLHLASSAAVLATTPLVPSDWFDRAARTIAASEYHFVPRADGVFGAPNRAHALRLEVGRDGFAVEPRTKGGAEWRFELAFRTYGREGAAPLPLGEARVEAREARAELDRGALVEWLVNEPRGVEHGLTLLVPPPSGDGPLVLDFALRSDLLVVPAGSTGVALRDPAGRPVLSYAGLRVVDGAGRELPARLTPAPGALRITIDDTGAAWPLTVDPLLTAAAWTANGGQAGAQLGTSVAAAGDVDGDGFSDVIVGVPLFDGGLVDAGRALMFRGSAAGLASTPSWTTDGTQAGAQLGASVAAAGDVNGDGFDDLAVGAPLHDATLADEGRVQVWHGAVAGPAATPAWSFTGGGAGAQFGRGLAAAGDIDGDGFGDLVVGAPLFDGDATDEGRAQLFRGSATGLATTAAWTVEGNQAGAEFGGAVSGHVDVDADGFADVLVAAARYDAPEVDEGRALLFRGSASGLSTTPAATLEANQAGARFGASVALVGDVNGDGYGDALVGAPFHDSGETDEGKVAVHHGGPAGLSTVAAWTAESNQAGANLGSAVAGAGDVNGDGFADVLAGAPLYDDGETDEGRALCWLGGASGLGAVASWITNGDQPAAEHGRALAGAGDVDGDGFSDALVGAPRFDGTLADEGRASLFRGAGGPPAGVAAWSAKAAQPGAYFGYSVGSAGDVNGDGYADVIVGAYLYDGGQTDEGRAYVYLGSPSGPSAAPAWTAEADQAGAHLGVSVASAGDVNGDGYDDVTVGAPYYGNGQLREGRAWVWHGSATGLASSPAWTGESDEFDARFGVSVASAGDVNGDGYGDLAVGAVFFDNGQIDEGRAYLFFGSPQGVGRAPAWTAEGNRNSVSFGFAVAAAGDVNRDGYGDLLVGARLWRETRSSEGRALLYLGSAAGPSALPAWTYDGGRSNATAGTSLASAGDVNGDGYADVIVGAPGHTNDLSGEGRAYVFLGSPAGLGALPSWTGEGNQAGAAFGGSVAAAGDVDGDGFGDIVVGARGFDNGQVDEGRIFVHLGSAAGTASLPAFTAESDQTGALLGVAVAGAGDVNGDGFGDVLAGAYLFDDPNTDAGSAFAWLGNGGDGPDRRLRQFRADGTAPIAALGRSDSPTSFRARALGRTPLGRGSVRLEWEVEPFTSSFDGLGIGRTAWRDTGAPGPGGSVVDGFDESVAGLDTRLFKWRARLASRAPLAPRTPWLPAPFGPVTTADLRGGGCVTATFYADADGDGYGNAAATQQACAQPAGWVRFAGDCNDANAAVWSVPGVVQFLRLTDRTTLSWTVPGDLGGTPGGQRYDTLRATSPAGFAAATCIESGDGADTVAADPSAPAIGSAYFYLVRAATTCGPGALGVQSDGTPRTGRLCP